MGITPFWPKNPIDQIAVGIDFTDELPEGVTLDTGVCSVIRRKDGVDVSDSMLLNGTNATVDDVANTAKIVVSAGAVGNWYHVFFFMTYSDSQTVKRETLVFVDQ